MPDIIDPWDDTVEGYYDGAVHPPHKEMAEPALPTAKAADLAGYRARCAQLWVDYRAGWCECEVCLVAHKPQPGKKRDPITGNGCPLGAAQWRLLQANLAAARDEFLPHGHPETARRGCVCDACKAVKEAGKLPPGVPHGLRAYQKYNCKCEVCKAASAAYRKDMRERKAATERGQLQMLQAELEALRAALKAKS